MSLRSSRFFDCSTMIIIFVHQVRSVFLTLAQSCASAAIVHMSDGLTRKLLRQNVEAKTSEQLTQVWHNLTAFSSRTDNELRSAHDRADQRTGLMTIIGDRRKMKTRNNENKKDERRIRRRWRPACPTLVPTLAISVGSGAIPNKSAHRDLPRR